MMHIKIIEQDVKKIISNIMDININKLTQETNLKRDIQTDSLDTIEIIMSIEKKFNITIPDEVIEKLNTIQSIIQYIENIKKYK